MNGDNFKPVSAETSAWVLQQHFAMQDVPVDACGPTSLHGDAPATKKFGGNRIISQAHRKAISSAQIKRFCERKGITTDERLTYRKFIASYGMTADEALSLVIQDRKARR